MFRAPFGRLWLGAIIALLLSPGSASAAPPFTLDPSPGAAFPTLAVDSAGTAHIAWNLKGPGIGDDAIVYCQVPRGSRSCARKQTLAAPLEANSPPQVLLPGDGRILILTSRCCTIAPGAPTYLLTSTDGGASFSAPLQIGTNQAAEAALGPGEFSVSTISDVTTGGVTFEADPLAGPPPPKYIVLGAIPGNVVGAGYSGSIAFVDPLTPLVAMDDLETVYVRLFGGGPAYNDEAAWGPLTPVAKGDGPQLAGLPGGKRGIHLLYRAGTPGKWILVDRRYKGGTSFTPATPVSEKGDPIFQAFFMDPSGRLHAVWVNNVDNSLRHRAQPSGKAWAPIETLMGKNRADDVFDTEGAAAKDGGGFAVWDANDAGPVRAIAFGPKGSVSGGGGGGGECVDELKVGGATVAAQEGCLKQDPNHKSRYTTKGDVRVNGIDLLLGGGSARASATASTAPKLTVDINARTLVTSGKVEAKVGNVKLADQVLEWKLPAGKGQITDLAGNPAAFDTGKFHVPLLGLTVVGYTVPSTSGQEKIEIPVNLNLPAPFDSIAGDQATGSATLRASNDGGLDLSGFQVHLENVSLGIAQIKSFNIDYVGDPYLLHGDTDILLPPVGARLGAAFGLREGDFDYARGEFEFPPGQLAVATDVFLRAIRFGVQKASSCDKPTKIEGGVTFATGPEVAGVSLINVEGNVIYSFPRSSCGTPGVLAIDGTGKLISFPVATLHSRFTTDGQLTFSTVLALDLSVASASISLEGGVDIPAKAFYAEGQASIKAFGFSLVNADSIISTEGLGVCGAVGLGAEMGFEYHWGEAPGFDNFDAPPDCDVDIASFKPTAFSRPLRAQTSASAQVSLPRGLRSATLRLSGAGAPPGFDLKGPGGLQVTYPSAPAGVAAGRGYVAVPVEGATYVKLLSPKAGGYSVSGVNGPAITGIAVAKGLPNPKVSARVLGKGAHRTLSFRVRPIPDQQVLFVEQGHGVKDVIGLTAKAHGGIHFKPALGTGRRRTVLAIVTERGMPRASLGVAHFTAPPSLPGRPKGVRMRRSGAKLVVSWKSVPRASRVAVGYRLADGRHLAEVVRGHRAVIGNVPGIDSGRIEVAGLRRDNVAGESVKVRLKAKPKRLHRKKGRRRRHGRH